MAEGFSKPRPKASGGAMGILPPPPGGIKVAGPPKAKPDDSPQHLRHTAPIQPATAAVPPSGGLGIDFLDFDTPSGGDLQQPAKPIQQNSDPWGDFASAS